MSYNGHIVVDADSHIREYWDFDRSYKPYVDPKYRETYEDFSKAVKARQKQPGDVGESFLWPRLWASHPMGMYDDFTVGGNEREDNPNPAVNGNIATTGRGKQINHACNWDPTIRLQDMDKAGVDVAVIFPSQSDGFCMLHDVGFESALHWAYQRFVNDHCAESAGRLRWVGDSNVRDIPETINMLRYWTEHDDNFVGMFIPRALPDGSMLDHPSLWPLFEASQELDMPIWVHGGANRPPYTPWVTAANALYHGIGGMYALTGLYGGGVFDRFPRLRIGLFEAFCGWMPWMIEKLDDGYAPGSKLAPYVKRTATEIVQSGQLFVSIEADERLLEQAVENLGDDIFLLSTDYPHSGTSWPDAVELVTEREGLSDSAKLKILGENAQRFCPRLTR